jgi:hypothetical protein
MRNLWRPVQIQARSQILILDKKSPENDKGIIVTYRRFFLGICQKGDEEEKESTSLGIGSKHCGLSK